MQVMIMAEDQKIFEPAAGEAFANGMQIPASSRSCSKVAMNNSEVMDELMVTFIMRWMCLKYCL